MSEFNIKPPLRAPLLIFPRAYLLKSFPQVDTSARQRGFEIRVFPLLGELPKAIEPHLPVLQLYRWQLGPNMWSSPTTKSLDPIVVTALWEGFPWESHGPATCGFACNCPEPVAWTTEASGLSNITCLALLLSRCQISPAKQVIDLLILMIQTQTNNTQAHIYVHVLKILSIITITYILGILMPCLLLNYYCMYFMYLSFFLNIPYELIIT